MIGTTIGSYRVLDKLGAGGMGEVYRGRDARLNRDVAIKVLPEMFTLDTERLARFEREAQVLAALNHSNIATVYGVLESPPALVMELVEGDDLAAILARGPLPLDETLAIGRQIADALEAAHEQGIIHRDLKPANVKVRPDGSVKVLDFGLAKAMEPGSSPDQVNSPTFTSPMTQLGVVLGTAAYMAPEQAKGKTVDRRADIWAFGVVLLEMLTGRNPWIGETATETIANVITREADLGALPPSTPPRLRALIARCLVKDPKARLRDIGEARVALAEMSAGVPDREPAVPASSGTSRVAWAAAALMALAAALFAALWLTAAPAGRPPVIRASIEPPAGTLFVGSFALSPDGTRLVFEAWGRDDANPTLWVQVLATGEATPIKNTDNAARPFWSPDGRHIGFFADGKLKRIDLQGGAAQVIADAQTGRGGAWAPDGQIVFAPKFRGGLQVIDAQGGAPVPLTTTAADETSHRFPVFLPDGRHLVFLSQTSEGGSPDDTSTIDIVALDGTGRRSLVKANSSPFVAGPGFLLYWRDGSLVAQRMDFGRLQIEGDPFPVAHDVAYDQNEAAVASVSASGHLVYMGGGPAGTSTISWVDRKGAVIGTIAGPATFECGFALSPDATRLVVGQTVPGSSGCDLWDYHIGRDAQTRLTFGDRNEYAPIFSPDGRSILYASDAGTDTVFRLDLDGRGAPEPLFEGSTQPSGPEPAALTRDGRVLILSVLAPRTGVDIMRYDLAAKTLTPIVQTPFMESSPALSPDERWLAYVSDRSGRPEVYVEAVSGDSGLWPVSSRGGDWPRWSRDGRQLYFVAPPDQLMAVDVLPGDAFRTSAPQELFRAPFAWFSPYAPAPDGQRFAVNLADDRHARRSLTIVSDWRPAP